MSRRILQSIARRPRLCAFRAPPALRHRALTLAELMVSLAIVAILLSIAGLAFRGLSQRSVLAQSKNAVVTYAKVARAYAMANEIETMMVVNPFNGRFELWHLNPPRGGGPWDPASAGLTPPFTDGYTFAPVFDSSAALPRDSDGKPVAAVNPIDFEDTTYRPRIDDAEGRNLDNLTWAAFCFDANGELVIRSRRIATRTYLYRDGTVRPDVDRNRTPTEVPDLGLVGPLVRGGPDGDTLITSTRGFVISDLSRMERQVLNGAGNLTPDTLIGDIGAPGNPNDGYGWLTHTREGEKYDEFSEVVILNRYTAQPMEGTD